MDKDKLFTTGAFAQLHKVSKDTLLYYDRIGLFKPEAVGENGYRYYTLSQFSKYNIINSLKSYGFSLNDIKELLEMPDINQWLNMMDKHKLDIKEQSESLKRTELLLTCALENARLALLHPFVEPSLETHETEYYVEWPLPQDYTSFQYMEAMSNMISFCCKQQLYVAHYQGSIMNGDDFERENYSSYKSLLSSLSKPYNGSRKHIKMPGTYAAIDHMGDMNTIEESIAKLKNFIFAMKLTTKGDVYFCRMLYHLNTPDTKSNVTRISIAVE